MLQGWGATKLTRNMSKKTVRATGERSSIMEESIVIGFAIFISSRLERLSNDDNEFAVTILS